MNKESILLIENLKNRFQSRFNTLENTKIFLSPASIILFGDHTHYNDGRILSAAVDRYTAFALRKRDDDEIKIYLEDAKVSLKLDLINSNDVSGLLPKNLYQILLTLKENRLLNSGFEGVIISDIPQCTGLGIFSSFQIGLLTDLNEILKLKIDKKGIINLAGRIDLDVIGKISNKAHHFTATLGNENCISHVDLRSLKHSTHSLKGENLKLILCDTGMIIPDQGNICKERIEECEVGVKGLRLYLWGIKNLRDVKLDFLEKHINMLPNRIYNRCLYNVEERIRTEKALKYVRKGLLKEVGAELIESHKNLTSEYDLGSEELNFLVSVASNIKGSYGSKLLSCASIRTTLNLVKSDMVENFSMQVKEEFKRKFNKTLKTHTFEFSGGIRKIN